MAHEHIVYMMLADSAAQLRDREALAVYAPKLEDLAQRDEHRPYLAVAHRAWGIAHQLDGSLAEAESRLNDALSLFEELGAAWQTGRTHHDLGELALARADQQGAHDHFTRALEAYESLNAQPDIEKTRLALEAAI